jgi:hypothetical protein
MGMPQKTTNEVQSKTAVIPVNENALKSVALASVEDSFALVKREFAKLKNTPLVKVPSSMKILERAIKRFEKDICDTAVKAVKHAPVAKVKITGDAPAIIVRRSIGEAISRGDLRPGQKLPGQDIIFAKVWEPTNRRGEGLGKNIASFGAPENLPGEPNIFNRNQAAIGDLLRWHGHDGWKFDSKYYETSSYEDVRFKGYQGGSAIGNWGVPELPVVNGKDRDGETVGNPSENMLVLSRNEKRDFKNFVTIRGSDRAEWSQSCTEHRTNSTNMLTVHFPGGRVYWDRKDYLQSCVRPVVALELSHLIL